MNSPRIQILLVVLGFAFLTILTTYPLFLHMGNSIYGFPGDGFGTIWINWSNYQDLLANNFPSYHSDLIGAPLGRTYLQAMLDPTFYEGLVLTILTDEVIAYNLMVMLGIWASAFIAYLLAWTLWQNQWSAILSGIIFGFCPSLAMSASGHMGFTHLQWIPLYLLSLFYFKQKRNLLSAILCGVALTLVVVHNYYLGYIMIVATAVFILCWVINELRRKGRNFHWKQAGLFLLAMLTGLLLSLPWTGPILRTVLFEKVSDSPISSIAHRPYHTLFSNSARPWDYVLPPIDHPILGNTSGAIYDSLKNLDLGVKGMPGLQDNWLTKYGNWWGQMFLGLISLGLVLFGLTAVIRRQKWILNIQERFTLIFFVMLFAMTVWFAMPPEIPIGELIRKWWPNFPNLRVPTPSYLLYNLLPMFRRYMVFGIGTILSVSMLAGFGMRELLVGITNRWKKAGTIILIFGLVFFEFLHVPRHTRFPSIPQEYKWLASQPGDIIIAEYPIYYRYSLFFQRVYQKRMLNWSGGATIADRSIWPIIQELTKQGVAERLGALGVRYVLLHNSDYFGTNPVDSLQSMGISKPLNSTVPGLRLVKTTSSAQIFEVINNSAYMMVYPDPKGKGKKPWLNKKAWKWQSDTQRMYIINASDKPVEVTLSAKTPQAEAVFRVICEQDNDEEFRQLQWNDGRISIPHIVCAANAEAVIEVSFPNEIAGEATVWSDFSIDVIPRNNLVVNGTFASGCYWENQTGWTIQNGVAIASNVSGSVNIMHKSLITTPGRFYKVSYTVRNYEGGEVNAYFGGTFGERHADNGTYTDVFKAHAASSILRISGWGNLNCNIDNVSCYEVTRTKGAGDDKDADSSQYRDV